MSDNNSQIPSSIPLAEGITCYPIMHGKAIFSLELRKLLWNNSYDCIAIAFPERLYDDFVSCVEKLPIIHALTLQIENNTVAYAPIDPCDTFVEAVRQGLQRKLPMYFVEGDSQLFQKEQLTLPDSYLMKSIGMKKYYDTCAPFLIEAVEDTTIRQRALCSLKKLVELHKQYKKILFISDFPLLVAVEKSPGTIKQKIKHLSKITDAENDEENFLHQSFWQIKQYPIHPDQIYFALGELPFYAAELEKNRYNPLAAPPDYLELVKKIFIETRQNYLRKEGEAETITLVRLQTALKYIRNLTVIDGGLVPDLFDIITAAKGVFGSYFASKVLEAAKYYPFFDFTSDQPYLQLGVEQIQVPDEEGPIEALNLLQDEMKSWRTIDLKKEPDPEQQKKYRYFWDPHGMCSHTPEDHNIEGFNQTVRTKSSQIMMDHHTNSEKFCSSLKDGLDIRETIRNWHTGDIYVKNSPPFQKQVDTVIIIFDSRHDDKYPQRTTWYAEHKDESTLAFFATNPFNKMIGPGIAQAEYGGLSLLYPPRPIRDIFQSTQATQCHNLTEQLVLGSLLNSKEEVVAYVSYEKPGLRLKQLAHRFKKKLLWISLSSFSQETLRKLRIVHILNGKKVRSWASRFISN